MSDLSRRPFVKLDSRETLLRDIEFALTPRGNLSEEGCDDLFARARGVGVDLYELQGELESSASLHKHFELRVQMTQRRPHWNGGEPNSKNSPANLDRRIVGILGFVLSEMLADPLREIKKLNIPLNDRLKLMNRGVYAIEDLEDVELDDCLDGLSAKSVKALKFAVSKRFNKQECPDHINLFKTFLCESEFSESMRNAIKSGRQSGEAEIDKKTYSAAIADINENSILKAVYISLLPEGKYSEPVINKFLSRPTLSQALELKRTSDLIPGIVAFHSVVQQQRASLGKLEQPKDVVSGEFRKAILLACEPQKGERKVSRLRRAISSTGIGDLVYQVLPHNIREFYDGILTFDLDDSILKGLLNIDRKTAEEGLRQGIAQAIISLNDRN